MTKSVGIHEAKTHLSRLIAEVRDGNEITITSRGRSVARLVASKEARTRVLGADRGKLKLPTDEDQAEMDREILEDFERSIKESRGIVEGTS